MRVRIVALMITGLLLAPGVGLAQSVTPPVSPTASNCSPSPHCALPGFHDEVQRTFEVLGIGYVVPQIMQFGLISFDSDAHAAAALQSLLVSLRGAQTPNQDVSNMTIASMTPLGDRAKALSGLVKRKDETGKTFTRYEACFVVQTGVYLRFGSAWALEADALSYAIRVFTPSVMRAPSQTPVATDAFGIASGGLWDALPRIEDIPPGYHVLKGSS